MADTGFVAITDRIVQMGSASVKTLHNVESGTNMYPGRVAQKGSTDYDVVVGTGAQVAPKGFVGYEDTPTDFRPANKNTVYTTGQKAMILRGPGFVVDGYLAPNFDVKANEELFSFADGCLAPGQFINGVPAIRIPFVQHATEYDTGIDLPAGVIVQGAVIKVNTNVGGSTIDVGILSSESGGDADGLVDGASCASTGYVVANLVDATAGNITLGALLTEASVVSDGAGATAAIRKFPGYVTDGTAKSITYTTSAHAVAGDIYLLVQAEGVKRMGVSEETLASSTSAQRIHVRSEA